LPPAAAAEVKVPPERVDLMRVFRSPLMLVLGGLLLGGCTPRAAQRCAPSGGCAAPARDAGAEPDTAADRSPAPADGLPADQTIPPTDAEVPPGTDSAGRDVAAEVDAPVDARPQPDVAPPDAAPADRPPPDVRPPAVMFAGLTGYWKLDELSGTIAGDSSGANHHGTLLNGPVWVASVAARIEFEDPAALGFDGLDDAVSLTSSYQPQITVSAWIFVTGDGEGGFPRILDLPYAEFMVGTGDLDRLRAGVAFANTAQSRSDGVITRNVWHHVAYTYDGSNVANILFYIDGVVQVTTVVTAAMGAASVVSGVGYIGNRGTGDRAFAGEIDDVRTYDVVLTPAQIATLAAGR
jgi:Concanavalin A-like lectin/glucanases superfamily